ncbi:MAG: hypothetical protein ACRDPY_10250 [Streptosporangiaceae bacterium]
MVAGLLSAAVAGCGTQVATVNTAAAPATSTPPAVGCASVGQATEVLVSRAMHLVEPLNGGPHRVTQRNTAKVRALFSDLCAAVTHPNRGGGVVHCPVDFGVDYVGTFYDGSRSLASFTYGAGGCPTASLTASGKTKATLMLGNALKAAPHLAADLAAVLGVPKSQLTAPPQQVNPGGTDRPVAG